MTGMGVGGALVVLQVIMLIAVYGFQLGTTMPWWLLWLPGLVLLGLIGIWIIVILAVIVIAFLAS